MPPILRTYAGRFPRGVSGNPGGRPKRLTDLDAAIAAANDTTKVLALLDKMRELGLAGDVSAAKVYLDRTIGPVRSTDDDRRIEEQMHAALEQLLEEAHQERDARAAAANGMAIPGLAR
jgi:hypothetical protein